MMIVVPAFAKGQQTKAANVKSLHGGAANMPIAMPVIMGKISDQPVAKNGNRHTATDAPSNPTHAAQRE